MNTTLENINNLLAQHAEKETILKQLGNQLTAQSMGKLDKTIEEQALTSKALQALQDIRPILAAVSSEQSVALANQALLHVFDTEDRLYFSEEDARFYIETPSETQT